MNSCIDAESSVETDGPSVGSGIAEGPGHRMGWAPEGGWIAGVWPGVSGCRGQEEEVEGEEGRAVVC